MSHHPIYLPLLNVLRMCRLGTFYNATPSASRKSEVKEWAWEHYPQAYEDLLKCGTYRIVKYDEFGEEAEFGQPEAFFEIGPLGQDVEV